MTPDVATIGLTKSYGQTMALRGLDLQVEAGQAYGFLGPNGAGKSTTIRLLLALQQPTSGHASVVGVDPQRDPVTVHRQVGYLPGDLALYPRLTARRHIAWFAAARGLAGAAAVDLVDRFQVDVDRPVRELSKGNRQKVGLVLAFLGRPRLVVLDEPTTGLDPLMQAEFEALVRETVADGRTVFLSSHELDEVQRVCDRVGIIKEGMLVADDTVEGLRRAAPRRITATFRRPPPEDCFARLTEARVVTRDGCTIELEVTGALGPVLADIARHDPVDLVSRPADLDELFLRMYAGAEPSHVR